MDRMRRQNQPVQPRPQQPPVRPAPYDQSSGQADPGWWRRGGTMGGGWSAPRGVPSGGGWGGGMGGGWGGGLGQRSFGVWDGVFLWFLLSNLARAGSTDFFHNHQDDPGYREWRQEAERRAQTDAETRARLDELDRRLAERQGQPRDPNYLPPDVPADVAMAPRPDARTPSTAAPPPAASPPEAVSDAGGLSPLTLLVLLGGGGALFLLARRRRQAATAGQAAAPSGSPATGRPMPDIHSAAPRFRVGMTITCDPTPFLLGAGALQVPVPAFAESNPQVSIQAVGRIREGSEELARLYLPDGRGLFQLHADARGQIEECRYFGLLDEVVPADEAEWAAWLDPQQGMIGWPEFQTKNGKLYARLWAPGEGPVPPRLMTERIESLEGIRQVQSRAMLYAAPTGIAAPGPETEYILVSAQEEGGRAWVEIRAGIDINPASLSLV
ncbi:DUF2491 family protein [Belnapia sp. T6]|uniref:DUF2491 family protein n=1 Tax=Belnapia mucosa TaxID=2804532 RepID=A0ABS1V9J7_9PROT|nr:DUF2491 family protein [Belnapia mucosa]